MLGPRRSVFALLLIAISTEACSRKRPAAAPEPEQAPASVAPSASEPRAVESAPRDDNGAAERERRRAERNRILESSIYFEYDRSDLSAEAREILDQKLGILRSEPSLQIAVFGHTDDRGSDEYNLALGQRRAEAAKRYLTQRGVDPSRIETSSLGEQRKLCFENNESCWSRNRRDEFQVTTAP